MPEPKPKPKEVALTCAACGKTFTRTLRAVQQSRREGHRRSYCSQACARAGAIRQGHWRRFVIPPSRGPIDPEPR